MLGFGPMASFPHAGLPPKDLEKTAGLDKPASTKQAYRALRARERDVGEIVPRIANRHRHRNRRAVR
jgi:hypothetical protein